MAGMKISDLDFVRLLPAFMRDDEAAIALSKAMNKLIQPPGSRIPTIRKRGTRSTASTNRNVTSWRGSWILTGTTPPA